MKILAISGSYRNKTTDYCIEQSLSAAKSYNSNITTEVLLLRKYKIEDCNHCNYCIRNKCGCIIKDDMDALLEKFVSTDAYLLASPVYTYNPTPLILRFFNRMRPLRAVYGDKLFGKIGGVLAIGGARNGGQETTISCLINCLLSRNIAVIGGSSGNYTGGKIFTNNKDVDGVKLDEIGLASSRDMGIQLAKFLEIIRLEGTE